VNDTNQTLTLDGQLYAFADLPPVAHDTLASIQFVEARLQQLRGEMAVSQTAHVAYARALKAELAQTPGTVSSTMPSP
jgi:hypothetical protein